MTFYLNFIVESYILAVEMKREDNSNGPAERVWAFY